VHHAHQRGILHRDLKPANILLDTRDQPHVADFGLAKRVEGPAPPTQSGAVLGTPSYMAPEQAAGRNRELTTATDVYGLGAVLYELLTGRAPFRERTDLDTMLKVVREEPVLPSRLRPGLPSDLETVCLKCLRKDPSQRYQSSEAMARDLGRFLSGEPVEARPIGNLERIMTWVRRRPAQAALTAVSLTAGLCLLVGWLYFTAHLQASERSTSQERDRAQTESNRARNAEADARNQLDHVRRTLLTAQIWRAAAIAEREPAKGLELLEDAEACPPDLRDFTWRLYHQRCNRFRGKLVGHKGYLKCLAFSPRGTILASPSDDATVKLWDVASHKVIRALQGHEGAVTSVAFNRDGSVLASGSDDGTVRLWDTAGNALAVLEGHEIVNGVAFSPDGKLLAVGDYKVVRLWDVGTGRLHGTRTCRGETFNVYSVAFTPDGKNLLAWNGSDCITIWDLATDNQSDSILEKSQGSVSAMALSPDGKTVVVFHGQESPKLWDVAKRTMRTGLKGSHVSFCRPPVFTPNSELLVGWSGNIATFHDTVSGEIRFLLDTGKEITCLAFTTDGKICATGNGKTVMFWDVTTNPWRAAPKSFGRGSHAVLSRNGEYVASEANDGSVSVRLVETGERLYGVQAGVFRHIEHMVLSTDGQRLAVWQDVFTPDGKNTLRTEVILWDVVRGQETARLLLSPSSYPCMKFSPDSRILAVGETDGVLRLWDATDGSLKCDLAGHTLQIQFLDFAADGKTLVSGAKGAANPENKPEPVELLIWSTGTGERIGSVEWPIGHACGVALSPEGRILGVAGCDGASPRSVGTIRLWEVATGKTLLSHRGGCDRYASLAFSEDGKTLAVGQGTDGGRSPVDRGVELWDVPTMQHRATLHGQMDDVDFVAFTPGGNKLITQSVRSDVRIWEADQASE
jgi:WD40 repeat protein